MPLPRVLIVFTGGTISMRVDAATGGAVPALTGEDIVRMVPGLASVADVHVHNYGQFPGPHMTPARMLEVRDIIRSRVAELQPAGVVVTHGTDTLEETAYFLDLTLGLDIPVVVTGAMKTSSASDWDGPANLTDAVRVAVDPAFRGIGVLVCLAGEINAASEVSKTHTDEVGTFHSFDFGPLAVFDGASPKLLRDPHHRETIGGERIAERVALVKCYAGMTSRIFDHILDDGVDGLVVEAMGVGNVPPPAYEAIKRMIESGIVVVLVSRCPIGRPHDDYAYYGAGHQLKQQGVIFADYLNGQKARMKLIVALGATRDREKLRGMFEWA